MGIGKVNKGYEPAATGSVTASDGATGPAGQKAAVGNMGVKVKGKSRVSQGGDKGGFAAGRSRTNTGKNNTGSGPQGMKG